MTMQELEAVLGKAQEFAEADEYKAFYRAAMVAATIANVNRKRGARAVRPEDFIGRPPWEKAKQKERRPVDWAAVMEEAQAKGIKIPSV
ncbi:MAG: hypothetical protein H5U02_00585 [Clostridia bacterium]|nr:hypothetical protein [Clostridia bacterium]